MSNHRVRLPDEIWDDIFRMLPDPAAFVETCRAFHRISCDTSNRLEWLRGHHAECLFASDDAFEVFDSTAELSTLQSRVPRKHRLIRLLLGHDLLLRVVSDSDLDDPNGLLGGKIGKRQRGAPRLEGLRMEEGRHVATLSIFARRLLRFTCYARNVAALNYILENSMSLALNRRELSAAAAFAICSESTDCLLPILLRNPSLMAHEHLAFCEAIRTDNLLAAQLLQDLYKRQVGTEVLAFALKKAMLWTGKSLTLHYMLKSGASIMFFDWNYFARINAPRFPPLAPLSVFSDILAVLIHHMSVAGSGLDFTDFRDEAFVAGCRWDDIPFLNSLVELGLSPSAAGGDGEEALVAACTFGSESAVRWLLSHGLQATDRALIAATAENHESVVSLLLDSGLDVERGGHYGDFVALTTAVQNGYVGIVMKLAAKAGRKGRLIAMSVALKGKHTEVVEALCKVVDEMDSSSGSSKLGTELIWSALGISPSISQYVIQRVIDEHSQVTRTI